MKLKLFEKKGPEPRRPMTLDPIREYTRGSFLKDLVDRLKHRTQKGERVTVDIRQKMEIVAGKREPYYDREDRWTEASSEELHELGYLRGVRVPGYDSLPWWNVPVYVKVTNYQQYDIKQKNDAGQYIWPQDTPSTLHDEMTSNATQDFIKAMFKTTLPSMDIQKIIMIVILAAGAVLGLMMMGVI